MRLLAFLCIVFAFVAPARAQERVDVQLLVNDFSLTLYIEAEGVVSLADVGFRVGTNELHPLSRYAELLDLDLSQVRTPICIRLERYLPYGAEKPPMPLDCTGVQTPRAALDPADVFWFDDGGMNTTRLLYLTLASADINPPCPAGSARCALSVPLVLRSLSDVPAVPAAAAGEILFVLTKFRQVSGTEREPEILLAQTLDEAMEIARERGVNVRIALVDEEIETREQARTLADETGATVVIWGQVDPAGLDTHYEIVEREGNWIETEVGETHFTAFASLDEVDLRIRSAPEQRYVANFTIGQILYFDNQYETALLFFNEALTLAMELTATMRTEFNLGALYFYRGYIHQQANQPILALVDYTQAIRLVPNNANLYYSRGNLYLSEEEYTQAIVDYTEAIRLVPIFVDAYYNRGVGFANQLNYERAIADFSEAIRLDATNVDAYYNRGLAFSNQGNYTRAIDDYTNAIQLAPEFPDVYNNRGLAYSNQGDYTRAIDDYTTSIRLDPVNPIAYFNRGIVYGKQRKYEEAIADFTVTIRLNPEDISAYYNRGLAYFQQTMYAEAIADYDTIIHLNPENTAAYYARGITYAMQEKFTMAIADYSVIINLDPENIDAYYVRSLAYAIEQQYALALTDLARAITIDPTNGQLYRVLGDIYYENDQYMQALKSYRRYIELSGANVNPEIIEWVNYFEATTAP